MCLSVANCIHWLIKYPVSLATEFIGQLNTYSSQVSGVAEVSSTREFRPFLFYHTNKNKHFPGEVISKCLILKDLLLFPNTM